VPNWRGIDYADWTPDQGGGPVIQLADDASRIERPIQVAHVNYYGAAAAFLGYSLLPQVGAVKYISRTTPHPYEDMLDINARPWLYARSISRLEGVGPRGKRANGSPAFDLARMTLVYTSLTYDIKEDTDPNVIGLAEDATGVANPLAGLPDEARLTRYVTRLYRPAHRVVTIPQALMQWVPIPPNEPAGTILEATGKSEPGLELTYIHHLRPDVPINAIQQAMGKVNQYTFDGFPAETLLCEAPDIRPIVSPIGDRIYDVQFRFVFRPKYNANGVATGHNHFLRCWRNTTGAALQLDYRRANLSSTGTAASGNVYPSFNFLKLFRPD
jgi:hypothetical protein